MFYTFACQEVELKVYAVIFRWVSLRITLRSLYSLLYLAFSIPSAIALVIPFLTFIQQDKYRWTRVVIYVALVASSLIFGLHTMLKHGMYKTITLTSWYPTLLLGYLAYGIGVTVYSSRVPEKLCPGKFDIFVRSNFAATWRPKAHFYLQCHSHQIWHVIVFIATYIIYYSIASYIPVHSSNECHQLLGLGEQITSSNLAQFTGHRHDHIHPQS